LKELKSKKLTSKIRKAPGLPPVERNILPSARVRGGMLSWLC
jgi:hypothetical protein